jgi:hypothetical protein
MTFADVLREADQQTVARERAEFLVQAVKDAPFNQDRRKTGRKIDWESWRPWLTESRAAGMGFFRMAEHIGKVEGVNIDDRDLCARMKRMGIV